MKYGESDVDDKSVYKVYIWVLLGIIFGKEKEALNILIYHECYL